MTAAFPSWINQEVSVGTEPMLEPGNGLEILAGAGEYTGAQLARVVAAHLRHARKLSHAIFSVGNVMGSWAWTEPAALHAAMAARFGRLGVHAEMDFGRAMNAFALSMLKEKCSQLVWRGFRREQVLQFRRNAWRVFKLKRRIGP